MSHATNISMATIVFFFTISLVFFIVCFLICVFICVFKDNSSLLNILLQTYIKFLKYNILATFFSFNNILVLQIQDSGKKNI